MIQRLIRVGVALAVGIGVAVANDEKPPTKETTLRPKTPAELQKQIEGILSFHGVAGAGVAIVQHDGKVWTAGIGLADLAAKKPATADTLFRIGSISKGFVSLSVLKLVEEGKLSLQDTLRSRAPDLEFSNPWEDTDPVRIVNLLEHTSGWDDLSMGEFVTNVMPELTLHDGFAISPHSRTSRWKPGTRYSYSNAGPAAAAYVVEKVTGMRFEDYVAKTWFEPLGMNTASYFDTPDVQARLTKLYSGNSRRPVPYWHIIMRPSGAINASPNEMANYLRFYLGRGTFEGATLLPASAIDRMETPTTTYAAREGLKVGYGLSNYATLHGRWVYHGHNGGLRGALSEMGYLSNEKVGYVVMINRGDAPTLNEITAAVRSYITYGLISPPSPPVPPVPANLVADYVGWYEPITPRGDHLKAFTRITGLIRVTPSKYGGISLSALFQPRQPARDFLYAGGRLFRPDTASAPSLALVQDRSEGTLIQTGLATYRRVSWVWPVVEIAGFFFSLALMFSAVVFGVVWIARRLSGDLKGVTHLRVRAMPLLATVAWMLSLVCAVLTAAMGERGLGTLTFFSVGVFLGWIGFAAFAFAGVVLALKYRREGVRLVWWHSFLVSVVLSVDAVYLIRMGIIGWRPWA